MILAVDANRAAVIIILRERDNLGSKGTEVFEKYAETLHANRGRLFLTDVSDPVRAQLEKTGLLAVLGNDNVLSPEEHIIASFNRADEHASTWLATADTATVQDEPAI